MTKTDFVNQVATDAGISKAEAKRTIEHVFNAITKGLAKDGKVPWPGFGNFAVKASAARDGRNPQTGAAIRIAASKKVKFTPAKQLKDRFNTKKR